MPSHRKDTPVRTPERRRNARLSAAHPVALLDRQGRVLLRARTSQISETGLHCLTLARRALQLKGRVNVEIDLPAGRPGRQRHCPTRTVRYLARIVRTEELGEMVGLAIEFIENLD